MLETSGQIRRNRENLDLPKWSVLKFIRIQYAMIRRGKNLECPALVNFSFHGLLLGAAYFKLVKILVPNKYWKLDKL